MWYEVRRCVPDRCVGHEFFDVVGSFPGVAHQAQTYTVAVARKRELEARLPLHRCCCIMFVKYVYMLSLWLQGWEAALENEDPPLFLVVLCPHDL